MNEIAKDIVFQAKLLAMATAEGNQELAVRYINRLGQLLNLMHLELLKEGQNHES